MLHHTNQLILTSQKTHQFTKKIKHENDKIKIETLQILCTYISFENNKQQLQLRKTCKLVELTRL